MRNRTCGGVRGRKTKVGRKLLRCPTDFVGEGGGGTGSVVVLIIIAIFVEN